MPLITRADLARVAPHAAAVIVGAIVDHADDVLTRYRLATAARLPDFMAHVLVESAYITTCAENLSYSAERLHAVWPSRFPTVASAAPYAHNPEALADKVYGGRMGNAGSHDGWRFRGQGLLETTGHDNVARLAAHLGKTVDETLLFLTSSDGMLECAAANYVLNGAPAHADRGDIVATTRCVNGGLNGLADRRAALALCRKVWPRVPRACLPPTPVPAPYPAGTPAAPIITPQIKELPVSSSRMPVFVAIFFGLFGYGSAQAATVDFTPLAQAAINDFAVPVLMVVAPTVAAIIVMPLRRFLDQRAALDMTSRVNDVLDKAIASGARAATAKLAAGTLDVDVDGFVATTAAAYANAQAPKLMRQAANATGPALVALVREKVEARLDSHPDHLAVKSAAAARGVGVPMQLAGAAT